MKQPEELSAYKESVLQDIAQAQRVGADENAITALISQYPLDQALAARLARCYGPRGLENFNLDGIDVAALPAQQKHAKEPDQSVLQQVWEEHVALVMDQVCRMSPEYLDLEQETRLDILLLEQARAENNLQAMLGLEILHVAEDLNLAMQEAEAAEAGHAAGQPGACKMAAFARKIIHSLERQRESLEQAAELLPLVCDAQAYAAAAQTYAQNKKDKDGLPEDGFRQTMQAQRQSLEAAAQDCTTPCLGVPQDLATAFKWYMLAAEQNDAEAQTLVAYMLRSGAGVPRDTNGYLQWMQRAAQSGYAEAQFNMALICADGELVTKDPEQSFDWAKRAAEQGNGQAQRFLGACYEVGFGVPQDATESALWYAKAAQQGLERDGSIFSHIRQYPKP